MHKNKLFVIVVMTFCQTNIFCQEKSLGFYFQAEYSAMFLDEHIGNAVGVSIGITTKNRKWDFGIRTYGRSGPINQGQVYDLVLEEGVTY
mgnify:CR=1 FL=1